MTSTHINKLRANKIKELGGRLLEFLPQEIEDSFDCGIEIPEEALLRIENAVFEYQDIYFLDFFLFDK